MAMLLLLVVVVGAGGELLSVGYTIPESSSDYQTRAGFSAWKSEHQSESLRGVRAVF